MVRRKRLARLKAGMVFYALATTAGLLYGLAEAAEIRSVIFPADAGVVDMTKPPYNASGDGRTDATTAIQKAIDDHPNSNRIIYLPDGTYIISDTLRWPAGSHGGMEHKRVILQGQSCDGTVIRLKDSSDGYGDPSKPFAAAGQARFLCSSPGQVSDAGVLYKADSVSRYVYRAGGNAEVPKEAWGFEAGRPPQTRNALTPVTRVLPCLPEREDNQ